MKFLQGFWKDAHDEGGLAWDDSNNNRAFLSGTICATSNAASIYIESLRKADQYKTEKGTPLKDDIQHAPYPKGPAGQATFHIAQSHMIMGYSKNQKAAKDFLRWVGSKDVYEKWFKTQKGFSVGATREWSKHPMWNEDPVMLPFKDVVDFGPCSWLAGTRQPQGGGSHLQVRHHRHVREGCSRHERGGRRQLGARRARQDLWLTWSYRAAKPRRDNKSRRGRPIGRKPALRHRLRVRPPNRG